MNESTGEHLQFDGFNQPMVDASVVACPDCDLLQRIPEAPPGASVRCPRCDKELWRRRKDSHNRTFALSVAALVLYVIANTVPMLGLSAVGHQAFTTVFGGVEHLWSNGQPLVAGLVLFAAIISPALQIGVQLLVLIGCERERPPAWVGLLLRHLSFTRTWSMIEVMMLGVLVALTKIADYATVIPGIALFSLGALIVLLAAMQTTFDPREVWDRVEWADSSARRPAAMKPTTEVAP
jgi:paraquat-inducible protein A